MEQTKQDLLRRPIKLGDKVAYAIGYGSSGYGINTGYVIRIGKNTVNVSDDPNATKGNRKNLDKIIVITGQDALNRDKYPELYI